MLREAKVPIVGCAVGVKEHHPTQYAATFYRSPETMVRVDWEREPTTAEKSVALRIVSNCLVSTIDLEVVDSRSGGYPPLPDPKQEPRPSSVAAYYYRTIWIGAPPQVARGGMGFDLSEYHDEILREDFTTGIRARALRCGIVVFDFAKWKPGSCGANDGNPPSFDEFARVMLQRVAVSNAHLVCLWTAIAQKMRMCVDKAVVAPGDLIALRSFDDLSAGMSFGRVGNLDTIPLQMQRDYVQHLEPMTLYNMHVRSVTDFSRTTVAEDVIRDSFVLLGRVLESKDDLLVLLDLHAKSCRAHEDHDYNHCLIVSWSVTEKLLNALWKRYLDSRREVDENGLRVPFINKERRARLTDGRTYTAAVMAESLSLVGQLPFALYQKLNAVRGARNNWMHNLQPVSRQQAELAVALSTEMIATVTGVSVDTPLSARLHWVSTREGVTGISGTN